MTSYSYFLWQRDLPLYKQLRTIKLIVIGCFLVLINSSRLVAQPYSCGGSFPSVPNPGTNDIANWSGGAYSAANFVNYLDVDFKNGWNTLYGVTLNDFPFAASSAPSDDNLLSQWIVEGVRFMFYGSNGNAPFDWDYSPRLGHAALCDAACISSRFVPGQNPIAWVHQCVSDTSPFNDWVILLDEPFGTNWHFSLSAENILIGADNGESSSETIFQAFVAWIGTDGASNNGHFVPIFSCSGNFNMVTGIGVYIGDGNRITVWQRVMDLTGQQSASAFWQGTSNCSFALPVEMTKFEANVEGENCNKVSLNWQTKSEYENDHFIIERSFDKMDWQPLTHIQGAGNSYEIINYSFIDETSPSSETLYYRIKQVDFDGRYEYSSIRSVKIDCGEEDILIYPNPFSNRFSINSETEYDFTVFNSFGKAVFQGNTSIEKEIDLSGLPNGVYSVVVKTRGSHISRRVIKL